jgi:hypothetical protein
VIEIVGLDHVQLAMPAGQLLERIQVTIDID